jgi:hypothetical protein
MAFLIFTMATSPYIPSYGGKIWIINESSYDLFMELYTDDLESMVCIEKQETLQIAHSFWGEYQRYKADPNAYFKRIAIYNMNSGTLLKDLIISNTFILDKGTIDSNNAEFKLVLNDLLLTGGIK